MLLSRRRLLALGLAGSSALVLPRSILHGRDRPADRGQDTPGGVPSTRTLGSPPVEPFTRPLIIPPVLEPVATDEATDYYVLTMDQAQVEIIPGTFTTFWGYSSIYPGPTIKARTGRRAVVRHVNNLPESMSIHLHGGHTPPTSDGHPYDLIAPGDSKDYDYPNIQIPAVLWYHDHAVDTTGRHVYMGLAGFYLMTDELEDALPLPTGVNDVPLLIQDRLFNEDGSLNYPLNDETIAAGVLGDRILVNGVIQPFFDVARRKTRFRVVNGSNARRYTLGLSSGDPFIQLGSDGGLLSRPVQRSTIRISPAERVDVVIDFSRYDLGTILILTNQDGAPEPNLTDMMQFRVTRDEPDESVIPEVLRPVVPIPEELAVTTRDFVLEQRLINGRNLWTINARLFDPAYVEATPRLGDVEIWQFINTSYDAHPVHIHDIQWQILDINGVRPPAGEDGWKDTFRVPALGRLRVIGRFENQTGLYVFHCHKLEHEDHAMMAQFEVLPATG